MSNTPTATSTTQTKDSNMTDTAKSNGTKAKSKRTGTLQLKKLNRGPAKSIQETFRCTEEEHNKLVGLAEKEGFGSMSDYYRAKLGLDKA